MDRFWICPLDNEADELAPYPFGGDTVGIVDEEEGGIIAYVHQDTAPRIIRALEGGN